MKTVYEKDLCSKTDFVSVEIREHRTSSKVWYTVWYIGNQIRLYKKLSKSDAVKQVKRYIQRKKKAGWKVYRGQK